MTFDLTYFLKSKNIQKSIIITPRQRLFFQFASVEYEGIPYMTPQDFLESITEDHPRRMKLVFYLIDFNIFS